MWEKALDSIFRMVLNHPCSQGLGYKLVISEVFWIWSTMIKVSSLLARGIWRWEIWKIMRGNLLILLGCHLLCFYTLLSRLLQDLLPWCLTVSFSAVITHITSPEISEMLHKSGSSARSARLQNKLGRTSCGLYPGFISYAFKREWVFITPTELCLCELNSLW